jgi:hypothetical protein
MTNTIYTLLQKYAWLAFLLLPLLLFAHCKTETKTGEPVTGTVAMAKLDPMLEALLREDFVATNDLEALHITDTQCLFYMHAARDSALCTKTVRLNDNIFYSIISLADTVGVCSHSLLVTVHQKEKKALASRYLHPDCNVDFSWDRYSIYNHDIASANTVWVLKENYYKIEDSTTNIEDEKFRIGGTDTTHFIISPAGQISMSGYIHSNN